MSAGKRDPNVAWATALSLPNIMAVEIETTTDLPKRHRHFLTWKCQARKGEGDTETRWRCFSRGWIKTQKTDSLDIAWLKDQDSVDAASLPEPDVLAAEVMSELTGLMWALGAGDEAKVQRQLLIT